ncbi:MAG: hypothetical protein AAF614_11880 [Chloroflexota bacterium]
MSVTCYDVYGKAVSVATADIVFRPAIYGVLVENDEVLLTAHPTTKLWQPLGLILEEHIEAEQALQRYLQRVIQVVPAVKSLLWVEEQYRVDEEKRAWHLSALYYDLKRPLSSGSPDLNSEQRLAWIPLADLNRSQMQFGYDAIQAAQRQQLLPE